MFIKIYELTCYLTYPVFFIFALFFLHSSHHKLPPFFLSYTLFWVITGENNLTHISYNKMAATRARVVRVEAHKLLFTSTKGLVVAVACAAVTSPRSQWRHFPAAKSHTDTASLWTLAPHPLASPPKSFLPCFASIPKIHRHNKKNQLRTSYLTSSN